MQTAGESMLETQLRQQCDAFFITPVARFLLVRFHAKANYITLLALFCGALSAITIVMHFTMASIVLLLLSGYFDVLDGSVARLAGEDNPFGSVLDICSDRAVEFLIILALLLIDVDGRAIACIAMLGAVLLCVTSFLVVGIFAENASEKSFHYSPGLIERAEAFLFFIAMIVFPQYFQLLAWSFITLVMLTAIIRVYQFHAYYNDGKADNS